MKNVFAAVIAVVALSAVPAFAQDSGTTASGSYGQSKHHKSNGSAQAEVGERAPGDASSSTSAEGRPRAGIEVGTASATQGGRTDNGTPPGHTSPNDRSAPGTMGSRGPAPSERKRSSRESRRRRWCPGAAEAR